MDDIARVLLILSIGFCCTSILIMVDLMKVTKFGLGIVVFLILALLACFAAPAWILMFLLGVSVCGAGVAFFQTTGP